MQSHKVQRHREASGVGRGVAVLTGGMQTRAMLWQSCRHGILTGKRERTSRTRSAFVMGPAPDSGPSSGGVKAATHTAGSCETEPGAFISQPGLRHSNSRQMGFLLEAKEVLSLRALNDFSL